MMLTLRDELRRRLRGRVAVVGVGNPLRADDGVGSYIAGRLKATSSPPRDPRHSVIDAEEIPESFLGPITAALPNTVLLVDAVELGAAPGSASLLDSALLTRTSTFTHRTPLGPLADYLHHSTGADVLLLGIQPGRLLWDEAMGPEVRAAADNIVAILNDALASPPMIRGESVEMMAC